MKELAAAIHTKLKSSLAIPVFDHVPDETELPYVVHYPISSNQADAHNQIILEVSYQVAVYSKYPGFKEVQEQEQIIKTALHRWIPTLNSWDYGYFIYRGSRFYVDDQEQTRNVAIEFSTKLYASGVA